MDTTKLFILLFITLFILFLFVINITLSYLDDRKKLSQRISSVVGNNSFLTETEKFSIFKKEEESLFEKKIAQYLRHRPLTENAIRLKLHRAGLTGHLGRLFGYMALLSTILAMVLLHIGTLNYIELTLSALISTIALSYLVINFLERRFKIKITEQLPVAIDIILRGIKSGSSVERTFSIVVKEIASPLKEEFSQIIQKIEFGVPFDDALHQASSRIGLNDFYFFSTALIIQRKGGGSLAEILENIIISLNRANEIRSKIAVFSAESKVTAYILGSLPVVIWFSMVKFNPTYLDFFRFEEMGKKMLLIAIGLIVCAGLMMRHLMRIKI
jgi:tight adherence protein B